jgi:hypothetical protein
MSFDLSAIAAYIENRDFPLVGSIQFDPVMTASMATVQAGIKGSSKLHFLETDVVFQDGSGCSRTASGTTTFTDKTITVSQVAIAEDLCMDDLVGKWAQIMMKQGSLQGKQVLPEEIASIYFDQKAKKLAQDIDKADWQGDTNSGTVNLARYDGWIKYIDAGSPVDGNTGSVSIGTGVTTSNIIAVVQAMYLAVPTQLLQKEDLKLFMPLEWVRLYNVALTNANLFNYTAPDTGMTKIHGTNIDIVPTYGLSGIPRMFLTYASNLVVGVDGENDTEFRYRIDPVTEKKILVDADWTRGTQVMFTEDVVEFNYTGS